MGKMVFFLSDLVLRNHHPDQVSLYIKSKDRLKQQLVMMIQNMKREGNVESESFD